MRESKFAFTARVVFGSLFFDCWLLFGTFGLQFFALHPHGAPLNGILVLDLVSVDISHAVNDGRQELVGGYERGLYDEVDESDLGLLDVGCASVHEHGHWEAQLLFSVALVEELYEEKLDPLPADFELLGGVGDVGQMEHLAAEQGLLVGLLRVEVVSLDCIFELG